MPPKRNPPRAVSAPTSASSSAANKLRGVYGALTAKENQSVVRSVVIFGVGVLFFLFVAVGFGWIGLGRE